MKKLHFVFTAGILLAAGMFLFSQENETQLDRLSRQVESLRKEVSMLANQVESLQKELARMQFQELAGPAPPGVPPEAIPREFNGIKYYLVPADQDAETESP